MTKPHLASIRHQAYWQHMAKSYMECIRNKFLMTANKKVKVKVNFTLRQTTKVHSGSRCIAVLLKKGLKVD